MQSEQEIRSRLDECLAHIERCNLDINRLDIQDILISCISNDQIHINNLGDIINFSIEDSSFLIKTAFRNTKEYQSLSQFMKER